MNLHKHEGKYCQVFVGYDETTAEQWAMLAAMFSRSNSGVETLVDRVTRTDGHDFMSKFYVGYGHASIGDLCDVKLFIEGVPFYVACQLEHFSRFRGQESSTRYIDFSKQPAAYTADQEVYKKQIEDYLEAFNIVASNLKRGRDLDLQEHRAVNARAFDICRGLLPWGATTNVAWYGDIRSIEQHLAWLISDRNINRDCTYIGSYVRDIWDALHEVYPSSIRDLKKVPIVNNYPSGEPVMTLTGDLDFGSWRDLNRHRVGSSVINMRYARPINWWYTGMLAKHGVPIPEPVDQTDGSIDQRLLGQNVWFEYNFLDEEHAEYVLALRSKPSVHPTLRYLVQGRSGWNYKIDTTPDPGAFGYFSIRGNQTILIEGKEL